MNSAQTAGIVGAGIMGRLLAYELSEAGYAVSLFDKDPSPGIHGCSWVAGGMLSPYSELEKAEPLIGRLGCAALPYWRRITGALSQRPFFSEPGTLVVAHRQDMTDLVAFSAQVGARLDDPAQMQLLDEADLGRTEPELAGRFYRGVRFPAEAQLEPRELLPALDQALAARGVKRNQGAVTALQPGQLNFRGRRLSFDLVADCRGLDARDVLPLRGVRGEIMRFHAPEVKLRHMVRLMHPRYPLYIVPRPEQTYLIGATSIESDDPGPITVRSSLELLSAVYSLHPGFAEATVLETATGCRPAFADNLPRVSYEPGLLRINGLFRHGYLISPTLVEEALRLIQHQDPLFPEICEVAHAPAER